MCAVLDSLRFRSVLRVGGLFLSDRSAIDEYWERPETVSLLDRNLRRLETEFVLAHLSAIDEFADLGCGDGESTVEYSRAVRTCYALERSSTLRTKAAARFDESDVTNITLVEGDVLNLGDVRAQFNVALTQRVVINFMSWPEQQQVIRNIWEALRPGGRYIMIENTFEGMEAMNAVRRAVGLPNVPIHDWHNYYLHHDRFLEFIDGLFVIEAVKTFNLYYLLTRVYINMFAHFEGYGAGAIKDDIFDAADAAARRLQEIFGDRAHLDVPTGDSFGPIQGWVLRRMG